MSTILLYPSAFDVVPRSGNIAEDKNFDAEILSKIFELRKDVEIENDGNIGIVLCRMSVVYESLVAFLVAFEVGTTDIPLSGRAENAVADTRFVSTVWYWSVNTAVEYDSSVVKLIILDIFEALST